jgi:hypothetical protein
MPLSVGVLIIGSLYWRNDVREVWRQERLRRDRVWSVKAPIRYGKLSGPRKSRTYTMIFANLCEEQLGRAKVVECKRAVTSASDLISEAEWLWSAEENKRVRDSSPEHRISPDREWGCVALLRNPHKEISQQLLDDWATRVAGEAHYRANERRLVDSRGILQLRWPDLSEGGSLALDLLLATSNDAEPTFPTVQEIADAWKREPVERRAEYFHCNQDNGISTFEDQAIGEYLRRRRPH